jgi:hypothetical protein
VIAAVATAVGVFVAWRGLNDWGRQHEWEQRSSAVTALVGAARQLEVTIFEGQAAAKLWRHYFDPSYSADHRELRKQLFGTIAVDVGEGSRELLRRTRALQAAEAQALFVLDGAHAEIESTCRELSELASQAGKMLLGYSYAQDIGTRLSELPEQQELIVRDTVEIANRHAGEDPEKLSTLASGARTRLEAALRPYAVPHRRRWRRKS